MTHTIVQQSSNVMLVMDEYWYASTTATQVSGSSSGAKDCI
jgi:hypothetical protein